MTEGLMVKHRVNQLETGVKSLGSIDSRLDLSLHSHDLATVILICCDRELNICIVTSAFMGQNLTGHMDEMVT